MDKKRLVFMGTPKMSSIYLNSLINNDQNIVGVYTQSPRKKNRGLLLQNSPVHETALSNKLTVFTPVNLDAEENIKELEKLNPDLIIIMGSLEHCYNPNLVLKKCADFSKKDSILILECRGDPRGKIKDFFNHNHHRYFNGNTQELIMIKHGWEPFLTTQNPICGPTRQGGYFTFGRY